MEITLPQVIYAIAAFLIVFYFKEMSTHVKEAVKSIGELNQKVAVIIEKTDTHGHSIGHLQDKTDSLTVDVAHIKARISSKD